MLNDDLLNRLERLGLVDQEIIAALREQLSQSGVRVTPEKIAMLLVENGQLTRYQATKLIGRLRDSEPQGEDESGQAEVVDEELDLIDGVADEASQAEVVEAEAMGAEAIEDEPVEVDAAGAEPVEVFDDAPAGRRRRDQPRQRKVNKTKQQRDETKSIWDSFKIYGVGGVVVMLALTAAALYWVLRKEDADEYIARANKSYNQQNYAAAEKDFAGFLESYGNNHPHASLARTRLVMSQMYQFAEYTDPVRAVDEGERLLPTIEEEEGLEEERRNLAALLVDVAQNIATAAGKASETAEKQRLLEELDRQITMTENPLYVTAAARQALSSRLLGISEARSRVQRDIDRNLRLDETVAAMREALDDQQTKQAYDIRRELLREFPELRTNQRIGELVESASEIQQTLVKTATDLPQVDTAPLVADSVRHVVLTNLNGDSVPGLADEIIYVRAHGSILALSAADGRLLWRRYVGYGQNHAPVSIDDTGLGGVLLSDADALEIQRGEATSGEILWRSLIGESFSQPVTHRDDIYLSTVSGRVLSIDSHSGDARWATVIPQSLEQSPGINDRTGTLYLPGNHSNLYVLDRRDGQCLESYYLGHAPGTIAVPPVALQGGEGGHVFVFENAAPDYTRMHILKCDASGGGLQVAQPSVRLRGNVTVDPVLVLGRRLIVLTDRAEIAVFDIEQTAETTEQVTQVAKQVASYDSATNVQMAVGRNQMWITGRRIGRYELQVSTGRVASDWVINEGDSFIGKPLAFDEALFHARVLRGSSAVRVTAADPKSGKPFWQTDVGVPVSMVTPAPQGKAFHVVTSQAALFELDENSLAEGSTKAPMENPGGNGVAMRFEHPARIDDSRRVMLNQEGSNQLCVYDPSRSNQKLRLITMSLPSGRASGSGLAAGGGFLLPMDSGRIVLANWQTGAMLGSPFQPTSDPNQTIRWSTPVALPEDPDQVIIADDRKKIYRLRVGDQLRELASADLEKPLLGPTAILGDTLLATTAGPAADFLVLFDTGSLDQRSERLLDGRVTWGPFAAGPLVVLRTDDGRLRGFDTAGEPTFVVDLPDGNPVDGVSLADQMVIVTGENGWLAAIDVDQGKMAGRFDLMQPLSAAPLVVGRRLLVPGKEGVIYITEIPQSVEET